MAALILASVLAGSTDSLASIIQTDPGVAYEAIGFDANNRRLGQTFYVDDSHAVNILESISVEITPEYDNSTVVFDLYDLGNQSTSLYNESFTLDSSFNSQDLTVNMAVPLATNTSYLFAFSLTSDDPEGANTGAPRYASLVGNMDFFLSNPVDAYAGGEYMVGGIGNPLVSVTTMAPVYFPYPDLKFTASISNVSNVPEPTTLIIWSVLGVLGLAVGFRRRR